MPNADKRKESKKLKTSFITGPQGGRQVEGPDPGRRQGGDEEAPKVAAGEEIDGLV